MSYQGIITVAGIIHRTQRYERCRVCYVAMKRLEKRYKTEGRIIEVEGEGKK